MRIAVTTARSCQESLLSEARRKAAEMGLPFLERKGSLLSMKQSFLLDGILLFSKKGPSFWTEEGEYRFHLGTAVLRILQMERGNTDRLCQIIPPGKNLKILDCTFGCGGDSAVLSWFAGPQGTVDSLEINPVLFEIGREGLSHFVCEKDSTITEALRRIHLIHADFHQFLQKAGSKAYDVIYFDPMFREPVKRKENRIKAFRRATCKDQVDSHVLQEARRVARYKVIVKERPFSPLFRNQEFTAVYHHGQSTAYGVIEV